MSLVGLGTRGSPSGGAAIVKIRTGGAAGSGDSETQPLISGVPFTGGEDTGSVC